MEFEFDSTWEDYQLCENLVHTLKKTPTIHEHESDTWVIRKDTVIFVEQQAIHHRITRTSWGPVNPTRSAARAFKTLSKVYDRTTTNSTPYRVAYTHRVHRTLKYKVARQQQQQVGYIEWKTPPTTLSAVAVIHHKFSDDIGLGTFTTLHKGLWRSYPILSLSGYLFSL